MEEDYKKNLKKLISENRITDAVEGILDLSKNNERLKDEVILINSRLSNLEERVRKGMLNHSEEYNIRNQITDSLIRIVNRISKSDYILHIESSEIVISLKKKLGLQDKSISKYQHKIKALENEIIKLKSEKNKLKQEASENIKTIKKLEKAKLIKYCDKCKGNKKVAETLNFKFILKRPENSLNLKEKIKKQVEKQLQEQIAIHKLSSSETASIMTRLLMRLKIQYFKFGLSFREKEIEETIEVGVLCNKCNGTGLEEFNFDRK